MHLTSREAVPQILDAVRTGGVISDQVAGTIASWWQSPARVDEPITALSHGKPFNAADLVRRLDALMYSPDHAATVAVVELHALRDWVLAREPHLVITEFRITGDAWEAWQNSEGASDRPEGIEPYGTDVVLVADGREALAEWVYPGEVRYPADPASYGPDNYDPEDSGVWLWADVVDAAAAMLTGKVTGFWAQTYGADAFNWDPFWWQDQPSTAGEDARCRAYSSRDVDFRDGEVEIKIARLVGFTDEQETLVWQRWSEPRG